MKKKNIDICEACDLVGISVEDYQAVIRKLFDEDK